MLRLVSLAKFAGHAAFALVAIASATGVAQGAVPQIQVAFPTDAALTCPNILSEVKFRNDELDVLQDAMNKVEVNPSAETEAIAAAMHAVGLLSVMLQVPAPISKVVSGAGSMAHLKSASEDLKRAYAPLQTQFDFALDRMDYLHGLYQRRCAGGGR